MYIVIKTISNVNLNDIIHESEIKKVSREAKKKVIVRHNKTLNTGNIKETEEQ